MTTPEQIEAAILAAVEQTSKRTGEELVRWTPIRDRLPGAFWQKSEAHERLRRWGDLYVIKIHGSPYVALGDDDDREIARKYNGDPPTRIIA